MFRKTCFGFAGVIGGLTVKDYTFASAKQYTPFHPVNGENSICALDLTVDGKDIGRVEVEIFDDTVPRTAKNFRVLCSGRYKEWAASKGIGSSTGWFTSQKPVTYSMSVIHRVIPSFMMQAGDFTNGNGTGGRSIYGAKFPDEHFEGKAGKHFAGCLSMANSGPNSNGSQFFITFEETSWLNGKHVVFGQVVGGMDVVRAIEQQGTRSGATRAECMISNAMVLKKPSGSLESLASDEAYKC